MDSYQTILAQLEALYPNATQELLEAAARNEVQHLAKHDADVVDLASYRKERAA